MVPEFVFSDVVVVKLSVPKVFVLFGPGMIGVDRFFESHFSDRSHSSRVQKKRSFLSHSDPLLQVQIIILDEIQFVQEVLT